MGLFNRLQGELDAREQSPGLRMSDMLSLPEPQCRVLNWMLRQVQVGLGEVATFMGCDADGAHTMLDELREMGFVREIEVHGLTTYRVRLAPKRGRTMPADLWQALNDRVEPEGG